MAETRQSLLIRAQAGEESSWKDLTDLYRPFLVNWLRKQNLSEADRDDLAQEILISVVKSLCSVQHSGRPGAFRSWLRTIAAHRLSDYWRSREPHAPVTGGSGVAQLLSEVADPESAPNRRWDEEHDRYVLRCLLGMVTGRSCSRARSFVRPGRAAEDFVRMPARRRSLVISCCIRVRRRFSDARTGYVSRHPQISSATSATLLNGIA
jgi:RNA polymerase sigma factor (sigma-70 family)